MPSHLRGFRRQKAVLWEASGVDRYGQTTTEDPVELDVRWVAKEGSAFTAQGNEVSTSVTATVDRPIAIGSTMWLGRLQNLPAGTSLSEEDEGMMEVVSYNEEPDSKGRNFRRSVGLSFYRDRAPEVT